MIKKIAKRVLREIQGLVPKKADHKKIFSEIYKNKVWGENTDTIFYSGTGSDEENTATYTALISKFIQDHDIKSVVDLGCGDFRVGKQIVENTGVKYTGVDVVEDMIKHHQTNYATAKIDFQYLNIVRDPLPIAELCVIRQVLQHLSNEDIKSVLKKLKQYKYAIVTEHQPDQENSIPNLNKPSDAHIRLNIGSGVYLDLPPYNKKVKLLLTVYPKAEPNSKIVTFELLSSF